MYIRIYLKLIDLGKFHTFIQQNIGQYIMKENGFIWETIHLCFICLACLLHIMQINVCLLLHVCINDIYGCHWHYCIASVYFYWHCRNSTSYQIKCQYAHSYSRRLILLDSVSFFLFLLFKKYFNYIAGSSITTHTEYTM